MALRSRLLIRFLLALSVFSVDFILVLADSFSLTRDSKKGFNKDLAASAVFIFGFVFCSAWLFHNGFAERFFDERSHKILRLQNQQRIIREALTMKFIKSLREPWLTYWTGASESYEGS